MQQKGWMDNQNVIIGIVRSTINRTDLLSTYIVITKFQKPYYFEILLMYMFMKNSNKLLTVKFGWSYTQLCSILMTDEYAVANYTVNLLNLL